MMPRFSRYRSTLPMSIQNVCSGPIRILVLQDTQEGDITMDEGLGGVGGVGDIFLPGKIINKRGKN